MIYYKTTEEIELIRQSCLLVSKTHAHVASILKPGMTGLQIDKEAETLIRDHGAIPAFKGYPGAAGPFPGSLCVSVNETIVHGIPSDKPFEPGDVLSIDCGVLWHGFYGDAAYTFKLGTVAPEVDGLLTVTRECLYRGIAEAKVGNRIGDIGFAIQELAERQHGYGVVRELVGHGVGKQLHEAPEVPNYGKRGRGPLIKEGLVIAIEPMINLGVRQVRQLKDGWTVITRDRKVSAHYEHTIAVGLNGPDILSDHTIIEVAISNNPELSEVSVKS